MEVDEEPRDSTDPVGNASPASDPEREEKKLEKTPAAEEDAPPNPDGACCPTIMLPEDGPGSDEEGQKDSPYREQAGEAGAEEESIPVGDTVELREMDTTPWLHHHPLPPRLRQKRGSLYPNTTHLHLKGM